MTAATIRSRAVARDHREAARTVADLAGRPRILHVASGLMTGGAERMLVRIVRGFGPRADQAVLALSGGPMREHLEALGIPVFVLERRSALGMLTGMARVRRFAREFAPTLLQGWMYHGNLAAQMLRQSLPSNPACIWGTRQTLYDITKEKPMTRLVVRGCAMWSAQADGILYNSRVAADQHHAFGFHGERSAVIPNGFEDDEFERLAEARRPLRERLSLAPDTAVVGSLARFHPMKDHRGFLEAAAIVRASRPDVHFVLAGRGVDSPAAGLVQIAGSLGLGNHAHFLGETSVPQHVLSGMDILCSSSSWGEGFPNVLGEALARGVPCVATDVGDSREVIGPGGIVIPPRDPAALARGIIELLSMPHEQRQALADRGRAHVRECFAMDRILESYENFYRAALSKRGSACQ